MLCLTAINSRLDSELVMVELRRCLINAVAPLIWSSVCFLDFKVLIVVYGECSVFDWQF